jgi:hypothetical protein
MAVLSWLLEAPPTLADSPRFEYIMSFLEIVHRAVEDVPVLARFAFLMVLIVIVPQLSRRVRLAGAVGLLLSGVALGPHMLDVFPPQHPVSQFFSELGMLLLMVLRGLGNQPAAVSSKNIPVDCVRCDHDFNSTAARYVGSTLARL